MSEHNKGPKSIDTKDEDLSLSEDEANKKLAEAMSDIENIENDVQNSNQDNNSSEDESLNKLNELSELSDELMDKFSDDSNSIKPDINKHGVLDDKDPQEKSIVQDKDNVDEDDQAAFKVSIDAESESKDKSFPNEPDIINDDDLQHYHDDFKELKNIIESALLVSSTPLTIKRILKLFIDEATPEEQNIKGVLAKLMDECESRGIELKQIGKGFRYQSKEKYVTWLRRLYNDKTPKYSRAVLETLAIIAYRQPVTRGDIEEVRGVSVSSEIIKLLLLREWIKEIGKKEVPGRPSLYGTTPEFLSYFNLQGLSHLPPLPDSRDIIDVARDNQVEIPELVNPKLAKEWKQRIDEIHQESLDDDLPDVIEVDLNPNAHKVQHAQYDNNHDEDDTNNLKDASNTVEES